ncbi:MAG TPA: helix-turn-helix domain-containing protein [Noviherbaspirillum sp.]|jgi:AraC-like DNA-binding protein|uniref:helix-turn-helix domain-containing protein n=1 Tax=Noviherbaspirillum sp. TaxID=1926288 RepID=UPI002F95BDB5
MSRKVVLACPPLRPAVRNIMLGGFDSDCVHLPAAADIQLVVYLHGGAFHIADDGADGLPVAFVAPGSLAPRLFRVEPASRFIAATFRPSGFLACFGVPAHALGDAEVRLDDLVPRSQVEALQARLDAARGDRERVAALEAFLLARLDPARVRALPLPPMTLERLLLPATDLAAALGIGTRQLERRFLIHHGMSLRDYRRLMRFSSALAGMMQAHRQPASLAQAALQAGYVDQAHLTRDFRRFVGQPPAQFARERLAPGSIYSLWQLSAEELPAFVD